ncbi:MAG TPA: PadR family transcriptional regulator [Gemmatimonadaceae bacterium]|nr:PadR family transcriptional regulator [Gemmatimonadaceae bacterium]
MKTELLHGTLDVLVLKTLSWGRMHGYGIGRWIEQQGGDALSIEEGSLYPALYRLERKGLIDSEWGLSEKNRRAKYYRLTPAGRQALRANLSVWSNFAEAVGRVLSSTEAPARA